MHKPIVVLDTNIYISSLFWQGTPYQVVQSALDEKVIVYISEEIISELKRVLARDFDLSEEKTKEFVDIILIFARLVSPNIKLDIIKEDLTDNRILECAVAAKSDYIISGDKHLLKLKEYNQIKIISPKECLDLT